MKKFLVLLAVAASADMATLTVAGSNPGPAGNLPADNRETRACLVLLQKMSQSPAANTWRNRMRAWPCMKRAGARRTTTAEAGQ